MGDHFSTQAEDYAKYRPTYPDALYDHILHHTSRKGTAWDCATGNGQAAIRLAAHFDQVEATDLSAKQIANAVARTNVRYQVSTAEQTPFPDDHFDLITVAQAIHWFDHEAFYQEVRRVARPGALLAIWGYGLCRVSPEVDEVYQHYYRSIVGPYWPPERAHIDRGYRTIPFPFEELTCPPLALSLSWNLKAYVGYLGTWSATQRYIRDKGNDPRELIEKELAKGWGDPTLSRPVTWPIMVKMARIEE